MNKKPYIAVIILLILISLGLGGYIAYEKIFMKSTTEECKTVIDDVSIDINKIYKVEDILTRLDNAFNKENNKYLGYIYNVKVIDSKDFDKNVALYASIYSDLIRSNTDNIISSDRIKNRYEMIFGKALDYTPGDINLDNINVTYDESTKSYKYKASIINNDHSEEYLVKNTRTKLTDDLIVITRKVFFVDYSGNNATIYSDSKKSTKLGTVSLKNDEVNIDEVVGKYGSKLNTYDFTFKLGSSDEYNLYRIERTK